MAFQHFHILRFQQEHITFMIKYLLPKIITSKEIVLNYNLAPTLFDIASPVNIQLAA